MTRLISMAAILALATGCYDVEEIRAYVTWDVADDELDVRYEWRGLLADDESPCFDDAEKCADTLHQAVLAGELMDFDRPEVIKHMEGLRIEDGRLDIVAEVTMPIDSPAAQDLGVTLETQGRRSYLHYTPGTFLPLDVMDPPAGMERRIRRLWDGEEPKTETSYVFTPRDRRITLGVDSEDSALQGVLQAMPELEGELRRRDLIVR